jgi:hypothetical protein
MPLCHFRRLEGTSHRRGGRCSGSLPARLCSFSTLALPREQSRTARGAGSRVSRSTVSSMAMSHPRPSGRSKGRLSPSRLTSFRGPPEKARRHGRGSPMKGRYASSSRLIAPTSIPSSSFSSTSINSCEKPSAHKHSDSVRVTPNLKRRLSEFTNKGSAHAIAGAKANFPRYHVNRVQAVF